MARTTRADLGAQAEAAFSRALTALGHEVDVAPGDLGADVLITVDGIAVPVTLKAATVVTPQSVARMVAAGRRMDPAVSPVVVGDLITGPARDALGEAGWGWFDRRGHLRLRATGVHIDAAVDPQPRDAAGGSPRAIAGVAGISWAAALLLSPAEPPSMRAVARRVSLSHSAIVGAAKRLREASLVRADGRPLVPELFWALADEWHPRPVSLADLPWSDDGRRGDVLGVNVDGSDAGWAVGGTVGAAAWGAPAVLGPAYPPDFYVPTEAVKRQAVLRFGEPSSFDDRACTVAVAPTPLVCVERFDRTGNGWGHWRFASALFAALDLAQDRARGAEILADWEPGDGARVW